MLLSTLLQCNALYMGILGYVPLFCDQNLLPGSEYQVLLVCLHSSHKVPSVYSKHSTEI